MESFGLEGAGMSLEALGAAHSVVSEDLAGGFGIHIIGPIGIIGLLGDNDPGDLTSGGASLTLFNQVPVGSHVDPSLTISVTGRPFRGTFSNLFGAKVTESPVQYDTNGKPGSVPGRRAYIVDFGVNLAVLSLNMIDPAGRGTIPGIEMVLSWLGTDFSPKAAYGRGQDEFPPLPVPTDASWAVGLPGTETTKLLVQLKGDGLDAVAFGSHCRVTLGSYPTNVRASLNGRLPFWTKPGAAGDSQVAPGFAQDLNTLLASLTAPADIVLDLTSDAPGVLGIDGWNPPPGGVIHTAAARWGGQASTEVALQALAAQSVPIPFPVASPAAVTGLTLALGGTFPPWRSYPGQAAADPGDLGIRVDANFSVARLVRFPTDAALYGVALPVRGVGADAEIHLEVQADHAGLPAGGKPLAAAELSVAADAGGAGSVSWYEVLFATPATIGGGKDAWLVAKAKTGSLEWVGTLGPVDPATHTVVAGQGGAWDDYPSVNRQAPQAQLRLLRRPFPGENTPVLDVSWATPPGGLLQAEPAAATLTLDLGRPADGAAPLPSAGGNVTLVVSLTARATGTLTIKGATLGYQDAGV